MEPRMPRKPGIYKITNIKNSKIYVGYATILCKRRDAHLFDLRRGNHPNDYLQFSFDKYGESAFIFEVLEECSVEQLCEREHYWCTLLNTHDRTIGYNISPTGVTKNVSCSETTKLKLSLANKGKPKSAETKQKIRQSLTGKKASKEAKQKMSAFQNGRVHSEEHSQKVAHSIRNSPKTYRPIYQYDLDMNLITVWRNAKTAERELGVDDSTINACCKGLRKSAGKFIWRYEKDVICKEV